MALFSLMDSPCSFTQSVLAFLPCLGSGLELEMEMQWKSSKKCGFWRRIFVDMDF
jgi:hypothetical protein